jgi:transcriptional regulator with XRE-family HTH domain
MSGIPTIGDVVREWRRYLQISLTEFSKKTKLTKGYISELEHNKIDNPKPPKRKALAAALGITERDIVSRRMPPKSDEAEEDEDQRSDTPIPSIAHAAKAIPYVPFDTTEDEIEEIKDLIASASLPEEEDKKVKAALVEITKQLLSLIGVQRKSQTQKEG